MLVLTNKDVEALLRIPDCVAALEDAYRDFGNRDAIDMPRQDMLGANDRHDSVHAFKTMSGMWPRGRIAALRLISDILIWPMVDGKPRREKLALAEPGGRYNGSVLLFSMETGQLLAILNDSAVQKTRVGCTSAVAARHMARADSRIMGLLGTGLQAESHLEALASVLPLELVKVFSPNSHHRESFVARMREKLRIDVRSVDDPSEAASGTEILISATNATAPTIDPSWMRPGMHISSVNGKEIPASILNSVHCLVVHTKAELTVRAGRGWPSEVPEFTSGEYHRITGSRVDDAATPELKDVVAGKAAGRTSEGEVTCFYNSQGLGLQFAALGVIIYREAKRRGVGLDMDDFYFTQDAHS
jgi:ornithine cyclodeaminase/alanine dehydrogenase-like protein (mu-crystallin family)